MARLSEHGIRLSSMSPSFLSSNSTSHTWPFSAVAELIDNASDPGVTAKQIWIDVIEESGQLCLTFTDNGSGMTPSKLHKMLSFGFTEKGSGKASQQAIGIYGNGFKSGSMRLGRDALIFTKNGGCQSVGMLSQTYLENIKAQAVIVPIVPFNQQNKQLVVTEDSEASLAAILEHSLINSLEQLLAHFDSIPSKKGTKILIWNIRRAKDGKSELDFETDVTDIRMPEIHIEELKKDLKNSGSQRAEQNIPDMDYSLRAYLSILYLKPRTQIILRGKKVLAKLVAKRLTHIEHDVYKPHFSKERVKVTFGLNPKNKEHYGIMMYHKNRLIKSYEKVGCQIKSSGQRAGVGVIGVIECNFLKPAHNKQDFEYTKEYRLTLGALGLKLNDYWREVTVKRAREREFHAMERKGEKEESQEINESPMWLQCEECLKWRSVPPGHYSVTPENWNCSQNPNPRFRSCSSPEEAEESEEMLTPSYQKTHKKHEYSKSRKREKSLEVCGFQETEPKHQMVSRSSSEPCQPTFQPQHTADDTFTEPSHTKDTHAQDQTHTDHLLDHHEDIHSGDDAQIQEEVALENTQTQEGHTGKDVNVRDPAEFMQEKGMQGQHAENDTSDEATQTLEDSKSGKKTETNIEPEQREEDKVEKLSLKRKISWPLCHLKKVSRPWEEQQPDLEDMAEEVHPGRDATKPQTPSWEKTKQDSGGRVEKPGDTAQHASSLAWTHSPPPTQTVMVSPLSRNEGPWSRPLPPEGGDREAIMQKLAGLEKEAQRLRKLLCLEVTKTTQGTMTTANTSAEKPPGRTETLPASTEAREVGCQTEHQSSTSSSEQSQKPGNDQPEQDRPRRDKSESQSRTRVTDSESRLLEDISVAQESLRGMRNNVVVLLSALLPQLDLAGISMETSDVDNILQQIIDVNALKL
ncbi:MORC family CW-type zinc finger protein 3 [Myripristis murdjan]|uniref:MORC family CW-type zinc finger protein 3 n=1 Tax=Myripristis murdjan TaxID=586833 RepID=UPI001175D934|nr:MORC family CW-type zinc finger protein 3-like [Myripristis murdjan]